MFRSASDHHQGVNLYLAINYSVITVEILFHGYWLCGSIPQSLYCSVFGGLCLSWLDCLRCLYFKHEAVKVPLLF
jgi:hypothetical protein